MTNLNTLWHFWVAFGFLFLTLAILSTMPIGVILFGSVALISFCSATAIEITIGEIDDSREE